MLTNISTFFFAKLFVVPLTFLVSSMLFSFLDSQTLEEIIQKKNCKKKLCHVYERGNERKICTIPIF